MDVQINQGVFGPSDSISSMPYSDIFKTACDSSGFYEGVATQLFQHFMKGHVKAALARRVCATENDKPSKEGNLTT